MELTGHTILITGGASGIGFAYARAFAERGNEVIIIGRRQARLDEARKIEPRLHAIRADVADPRSVEALSAELHSRFPKLDVLMNNAGVFALHDLARQSTDVSAMTDIVDINLSGTIRVTSAVIDLLIANRGTVINVSSGLAYVPLSAAPIYSATKAAIHAYTTALRFQLADASVNVIELVAPAVQTESLQLPEGMVPMTTDALIAATLGPLRAGTREILIGESKALRMLSRIAPSFIAGQLWKRSRPMLKR